LLVDDLLRASAEKTPDAQALVCAGRRYTYAELNDTADHLASGLIGLGVRRGDRVAVYLENSAEAVISICGALRAGAVFVPINPTTKAQKLGYVIGDCEPAVLVADRRKSHVIADALALTSHRPAVVMTALGSDVPAKARDYFSFEALLEAPIERRAACRIDLDLAALIYTSGSSGAPKGVMLSHANITVATTSINQYLRNTNEDVILDVLPLSFDYGLYQLFLAFQSGASVVLERSFVYPTLMLELITRERVTALPIVPMIAALLQRHDLEGYDLSSLRYITNTGAALPPAHIATLRARLPHVRIFSMYGLTECKRVSFLSPCEIDRRPTSVGKPMENVEVYVADDLGRLAPTGEGELVIRGSNVMQGYWRAPEETAKVLKAGSIPGQKLLFSGDVFHIDAEGFMYFLGRRDDVIKSRGQRVSPKEVENVLYEIPGVTGAAVVGAEDPVLGNAVKVFLCVDPGVNITRRDVLRHCARRLEDFMVPKFIEFVQTLPRTDSGKILRRALVVDSAVSSSVSTTVA
jgi:long-chain acyl-CoA synthetase